MEVFSTGNNNETQGNFSFFQLPYPVQVEIVSLLSVEDVKSFAATSRESERLAMEQIVWKNKLWHHCKAINLCLEGRKNQPPNARILVRDPLLVDMKKLYQVLNPEWASPESFSEPVDRENFLSKVPAPRVMGFSSVGLQDLLSFLNTFFHRPPPIVFDPFSRGHDAPSFLLFGPPEAPSARRLALSLIASKNNVFETVGLVKGHPGGLGGGVTVEYNSRLMNILPVRRARPRFLVEGPSGISFHKDVVEVVSHVDGMIYYFDGRCDCLKNQGSKTSSKDKVRDREKISFENDWQQSDVSPHGGSSPEFVHPLDNEIYELKAMLNAMPDTFPPILVLLVVGDRSADSQNCCDVERSRIPEAGNNKYHSPSEIQHTLQEAENPWLIARVEVNTLHGIHQGINWLCERTRILKGK